MRDEEWWRQQSHCWAPFKDETSTWKERLKIDKIAKFESDLLKTKIDTPPQSHEILQTSVKFRDFAEVYLCLLKTYRFQSWEFY